MRLVAQVHGDDGPNVYANKFDRRAYLKAPQRLCEPHQDVAWVPIGGRHRLGVVFVQGEFIRYAGRRRDGFGGPVVEGDASGKHRSRRAGFPVV